MASEAPSTLQRAWGHFWPQSAFSKHRSLVQLERLLWFFTRITGVVVTTYSSWVSMQLLRGTKNTSHLYIYGSGVIFGPKTHSRLPSSNRSADRCDFWCDGKGTGDSFRMAFCFWRYDPVWRLQPSNSVKHWSMFLTSSSRHHTFWRRSSKWGKILQIYDNNVEGGCLAVTTVYTASISVRG